MPDQRRLTAEELEREREARALHEAEQTLADFDQTQSDSDQQGADEDQAASEFDQELSDRDQHASDRDQHASDRDQVAADWERTHAPASTTVGEVHDRSRIDRDTGTSERRRTKLARARSAASRVETAARRDRIARVRDSASDKRDRIAQTRDEAADARDRAADERERRAGGGEMPTQLLRDIRDLRQQGAALRHQSALERLGAASDREAAARDRRHAARERRLTTADELTGTLRRGAGEAALAQEIERAHDSSLDMAIAIFEVDGLGAVNEARGHAAGDGVLRDVVAAISASHRPHDLVARWGGDEFLLALPETTAENALQRVATIQLALTERASVASLSAGHAQLRRDDTVESLLARADAALLAAKPPRER